MGHFDGSTTRYLKLNCTKWHLQGMKTNHNDTLALVGDWSKTTRRGSNHDGESDGDTWEMVSTSSKVDPAVKVGAVVPGASVILEREWKGIGLEARP